MKSFSLLHVVLFPALMLQCVSVMAQAPVFDAEILNRFEVPEARQGVAVDDSFFYVISNTSVTKHEKTDGQVVMGWRSGGESIIHLDSGVVVDGRLYAAHSNYPEWPMASSVEIREAATLRPVASYPFDLDWGSMTWLDRHDDAWWGAFAGYDRVQPGQDHPYGGTANTRVVKMDDEFNILQQWSLPADLLARMTPMSNSGGSWGPDGYLYLTGHDHPEIYVMALPESGDELRWVATVNVESMNGQGIAWDRSGPEMILWGVRRESNEVLQIHMPRVSLDDF